MTKTHVRLALAALAVALVTSTTQAQLLNSWEGDLEGWQWNTWSDCSGGPCPATLSNSSTTGVTEGTQSLRVDRQADPAGSNNFTWSIGTTFSGEDVAAIETAAANPDGVTIEYDVTYDGAPKGTTFLNGVIAFNSDDPVGWQQTGNVAGASEPFSETVHVSVPFSASGWVPGSSFYQMNIAINGDWAPGSVATVYYDNLQIVGVPEPTMAGLFGLAGLCGLLLRRRHS